MFLMSPLHTSCVLLAEDSQTCPSSGNKHLSPGAALRLRELFGWNVDVMRSESHLATAKQNLVLFALWQCTGVPVCSVLKQNLRLTLMSARCQFH